MEGIGDGVNSPLELTPEQEDQAIEAMGAAVFGTLMSNQSVANKITDAAMDDFERSINGG
ncbi:MAG: hypothetical protein AAF264_04555 [Pseudomonadota bacterium]